MQSFTFYSPTEVLFGKGAEDKTAQEIRRFNGSRVFVLYGGGSVVKSGLLQRVEDQLKAENLPCEAMGGVQPNPRLGFAKEAIQRAVAFGADFILAVGGGSVIDTAKAVAIGAANPDADIWDYWLRKEPVLKSTPVGVVLTISAAGSETSDSAVLTNENTGEKRGLSTDFNRPKFAVMNPELTYTLPAYQIACGITDIMMHTLDRYFTHTQGNELTTGIAETLLRTAVHYGRIAMENHSDYEAMSELMWCGSLSHNGLTGLGAVTDFAPHQLGHELSGKFDIAHGASLAIMWGPWASYSWKEDPSRFVRYAKNVWGIETGSEEEIVQAGIKATVDYFKSLGMPTCFTESGIGVQDDTVIRDLAVRCSFYGARKVGNFKQLDQDDLYRVYQLANH